MDRSKMTLAEAAKIVGLSKATLSKEIARGSMPGKKLETRILIPQVAYENYRKWGSFEPPPEIDYDRIELARLKSHRAELCARIDAVDCEIAALEADDARGKRAA